MAELEPRHIAQATRAVIAQFPEMRGVEPTLSAQSIPGSPPRQHYILTFAQQVRVSAHETLQRWVRVTMNQDGEIIKITSSR